LYRGGEFDSVHVLLKPALGRARAQHDSVSEARILTVLGLTARLEGDLAAARELGQTALDLKLEIGLESELSRSYNALGLVAWDEARRDDALELFDKTLEYATDSSKERTKAVVSINRGLIYQDLAEFDEARAALEQGRDLGESVGDFRLVGAAVSNLAGLQVWTGDPGTAITTLQRAIHYFDSLDIAPYKINALGQLGTAYAALGEISSAIVVLDSAIGLARELGMRMEQASNIEVLAEVHRLAGNHTRALSLYGQAEELNEEMGLIEQTGADQRSRAEIYAAVGDSTLALEFARRALATHESVEAVLLADLEHRAGNRDASRAHMAAAKRLAVDCDARTAWTDVVLAEARIADRDERPRDVLAVLRGATADLSAGGYDTEWESEVLRARAYSALGQGDSAVAAASRAVAAVERVRSGAGSGMLRATYASMRSEAYEAHVLTSLDLGDVEAAFDAADRSRGRSLLEWIVAREAGDGEATVRNSNVRETERLLQLVGMLTTQLREEESYPPGERDTELLEDLRSRLAEARSDYEAVSARLDESGTVELALLGDVAKGAGHIRDCLAPDEALLLFFVAADEVVKFVATRSGIDAFRSPVDRDVLARRVRIGRDLLVSPNSEMDDVRLVFGDLHDILVSSARAAGHLADKSRLVIVPHGVLNYLPYAALVDRTSGRFLIEDYDIQLIPSAAAFSALRSGAASAPDAESTLSGGVAFAPMLESLPASRTEARAFRAAVERGQTQTGKKATEARVRDALAERSIVHVATHGVLNPRNPLFSRIDLAIGRGEPPDDGRLEVHELLNMPIRSALVFLSGCETGVGVAGSTDFAQGEDYATLGLAFLHAGAANVVATLWPIEDEGGAVFAEHYYQNLRIGGPATALAITQRELLTQDEYRSPFYWAGYQLIGAGDAARETKIIGR
jgi:CHAT domain-containing protein